MNTINISDPTIAAISTPAGEGGVAVIRISGKEAIEVANRVFSTARGNVATMAANSVKYGSVIDSEGNILDTGVVTVFRAPRSYTGEDTAEISCHGGIVSVREVLRAVLSAGAVLAMAGEFTKRAFLNGKLSLTQSEAVIDMITAKNHQALQAARGQLSGALAIKLDSITTDITRISGGIAAWIDYPEEDIEEVSRETLVKSLEDIRNRIKILIDSFDSGKMLREGINTVIVGKPNVGKSSLMNLLSGYEKSIVTGIAGTTRDVIEEYVSIDGIPLLLCDTAGIRNATDEVEQLGVSRAVNRLEGADLLLAVFDSADSIGDEDYQILERIEKLHSSNGSVSCVFVLNKSDNSSEEMLAKWRATICNGGTERVCVVISATSGEGIEQLKCELLKAVGLYQLSPEAGILANERQLESAVHANEAVCSAISALNEGVTLDAVEVVIEDALSALLSLSGKKITDTVVDEIFSKFCVGK